jgi:hypothetical protein
MRKPLSIALLAVALAADARAAEPLVPLEISYQGVLLDAAGEPRTGNVDLTLRIFDAPTAGTLVYKQIFTAVPLQGGVFSVKLGPTGASTDTPSNPLTTSLANALGGDVGPTGPSRFLQVTVGTEGALTRTQILSAPYALRAESAATADTADTANDVTSVNGLPSEVLNQLYNFGNADGSGPLNTDPREGTADTDGDGAWNFNDPDNDGDGISDTAEIASGNDINAVSPTLSTLTPSTIIASVPSQVVLGGAFFDPGLAVSLNGAPIAAAGVTENSATIAPPEGLPLGALPVFVERANGERSGVRNLTVVAQPPVGSGVTIAADAQVSFSIKNASQVLLAGDNNYVIDTTGDGAPDTVFPFDLIGNPGGGVPSQIAVGWGPDGEVMGLRCTPATGGCQVHLIRDDNGDGLIQGSDAVLSGPLYTGSLVKVATASIGFDAGGNVFAGFGVTLDSGNTAFHVLYDRTGDGDFADANESVALEQGLSAGAASSVVLDPAGRLAYAYATRTAGPALRVAYDRNGDGDFVDGGELLTATPGGGPVGTPCGGIAFDPAGRLAAVFGANPGTAVRILRDLSGDGDFADAADAGIITGTTTTACAISGGEALGVALGTQLSIDRNDDGDFADANEAQSIPGAALSSRLAVTRNAAGHLFVGGSMSSSQIFVDPF